MRRLKSKFWLIPFSLLIVTALTGLIVTNLWNWMMPSIFGVGIITFWQAIGLFVLGRLLIGGFHNTRHKNTHRKFACAPVYSQMLTSEKQQFSAGNENEITQPG